MLSNNATLTEVISELQQLQGINQKVELSSVIGAPTISTQNLTQQIASLRSSKTKLSDTLTSKGIESLNTESISDLVDKVDTLSGVRYASGSVTSVANVDRIEFESYNSSTATYSLPFITVPLNFKPTRVSITPVENGTTSQKSDYYSEYSNLTDVTFINTVINSQSNQLAGYGLKSNVRGAYINETGFRLPVGNISTNYKWEAYAV